MKKYFILTVSLIVILASCGKKTETSLSRENMLRVGKWKIQSGTLTVKLPDGRDTVLNYLSFVPSCHLDDYLVFHAGVDAALFSGGTTCNPSDPDSASFKWGFTYNEKNLSLYHGFDFFFTVNERIKPFRFDTLLYSPLVLDTLYGVNDTLAGFTRSLIVLDSIWEVVFDTIRLNYPDLHNTTVTDFSQSSFTINFGILATRPDSTNHHTGAFERLDAVPVDTIDFDPIIRPDTFKYSLKFVNY